MKLSFLSWALSLITQILLKGLGKGLNKLQHRFLGRNSGRLWEQVEDYHVPSLQVRAPDFKEKSAEYFLNNSPLLDIPS